MNEALRYLPHYTVDDFRLWEGDWELWQGTAVAMTPSPFGRHGKLLARLATILNNAIDADGCQATVLVEVDWIMTNDTVFRPDLVVVCGSAPEQHVVDTPALVVEVMSEGTRERDRRFKRDAYERRKAPYYWMIDPDEESHELLSYRDGCYHTVACDDGMTLSICNACQLQLDLEKLFQ